MNDLILRIRGGRTHNLKGIDLDLHFNNLIVISGVSGSGKSSLAFDTIFAEGHRRYVESLSSYARQFMGQMDKPDVDSISGLTPSIAIDQKSLKRNPRSTIGTITEIYDYLRVFYSALGVAYCPNHNIAIKPVSIDQIINQLYELQEQYELWIYAPLVRGRKGEHTAVLEHAVKQGYIRLRVDGELLKPTSDLTLDKKKVHSIEALVDKVGYTAENRSRITQSVERALLQSGGQVLIEAKINDSTQTFFYNNTHACPECGFSIEEITPRIFSFNAPYGACVDCHGLGSMLQVDLNLLINDWNLTINEAVFENWATASAKWYYTLIHNVCDQMNIPRDVPFSQLDQTQQNMLLYGTGEHSVHLVYESDRKQRSVYAPFEGVVTNIDRRYKGSDSITVRAKLEEVMSNSVCTSCQGQRLKPMSRSVRIHEKGIADLCDMPIEQLLQWFERLVHLLNNKELQVASSVINEITSRIKFLVDVGLGYLNLARSGNSLSGGEAQRIRLATQIGSSLSGVTYVLDEPSIGLHQRDNLRLIETIKRLRDLGNMVIVVEHDIETILQADYIVEIGPGAGSQGGYIVAQGTPKEIMRMEHSLTGQYLLNIKKIDVPAVRRQPNGRYLEVIGARENNLKNVNVKIPLNVFTCITGVSGSGKSTLVHDIIYQHLAREISRSKKARPGQFEQILGIEHLDKVINIDQSAIGKTPRSNPATYTGMFEEIRVLFALTADAKERGYKKDRFSFNVSGGRCDTCKGDGLVKIEMHFLPDVYVTCDTCDGDRYNKETLQVYFKGKNISDVLNMTIEDALVFFKNIPKILKYLVTLSTVGLGYMTLGQSATTLSGGEAQRVKLATELVRPNTGKTLYIMDEPTTGLHLEDIKKLLYILQTLVDQGSSVLVIEHNLDVIKTADFIIDMGPEGGEMGGECIGYGSPEEICNNPKSLTGQYLKSYI